METETCLDDTDRQTNSTAEKCGIIPRLPAPGGKGKLFPFHFPKKTEVWSSLTWLSIWVQTRSQVKLLEFPRYKINYRNQALNPMITVSHPFVYGLSSPSWNGVAQLKIRPGAEAAHLGVRTPTGGAVRASGAEDISDFQCCGKQSWFGEGIETKATSLQNPLLLLSLMWCWHFHYKLIFPGSVTQS